MRTFDLSPLYRSTVGFDRLFNMLDGGAAFDAGNSYPPYNIERLDENTYEITMAVAGFGENDIEIEVKENALTVSGNKTEETEEREFLHRGIATRAFERRFQLADHVQVKGAKLDNGLLTVELERVIPEALKPRRIEISAANGTKTIENKAA